MASRNFLSESERLKAMSQYENRLRQRGFLQIAGVDEAGRGPLAGPVYAAACILPVDSLFPGLNDSKQLAPEQRESLFAQITGTPGVVFGISSASVEEIDRFNILQATFLAMRRAVHALSLTPDFLLIDGNRLPATEIPAEAIIQGDALSVSIAAASILAKVTRDQLMDEYDRQWPVYGFKQHKGYGTIEHLKALRTHGPCPIHRMSFDPIKSKKTNLQDSFL